MGLTKATTPITLDDVEYQLTPLSILDIESIDNWLRARIIKASAEAITDMPQEIADMVLQSAMRAASKVTILRPDGIQQMLNPLGIAKLFHVSLVHEHPDLELSKLVKIMSDPVKMKKAYTEWASVNNVSNKSDGPSKDVNASPDPTTA